MKCPKCGYNSFEFLDQCKKCQADLGPHKTSCAILSILQPKGLPETEEQNSPAAPALPEAAPVPLLVEETAPATTGLFDVGLAAAAAPVAAPAPVDPFFDGEPEVALVQPEIFGAKEEFDEGEEASALLLEELINLEELPKEEPFEGLEALEAFMTKPLLGKPVAPPQSEDAP
jgi:hypothetical protein